MKGIYLEVFWEAEENEDKRILGIEYSILEEDIKLFYFLRIDNVMPYLDVVSDLCFACVNSGGLDYIVNNTFEEVIKKIEEWDSTT